MRFRSQAILLLLLSALCGCVAEQRRSNDLEATLYRYQSALRWGYWDSLRGFRHREAPAIPDLDFDNVRVTSYEVRMPPVALDENSVVQTVELEYVLVDRQRLRKVRDEQLWRYDPESGRWWLHSAFPDLR